MWESPEDLRNFLELGVAHFDQQKASQGWIVAQSLSFARLIRVNSDQQSSTCLRSVWLWKFLLILDFNFFETEFQPLLYFELIDHDWKQLKRKLLGPLVNEMYW